MEIGNIIAQLRNQRGLNQRDFAQALGVSNGAVAMWETNKRQPDLEMVKKISAFFNVSVGILLGTENFHNQPTNENKKENYYFFFDDLLKKIFTTRLQKSLSEKKLTEGEFCELVSFDIDRCKSYLNGECEPSLEDLIEISQILEVSTDYLLGQIPKISDPEKKLLNAFNKLTPDDQDIIIGEIKKCLKEQRRGSVAADESLNKTGTDNLGK